MNVYRKKGGKWGNKLTTNVLIPRSNHRVIHRHRHIERDSLWGKPARWRNHGLTVVAMINRVINPNPNPLILCVFLKFYNFVLF